jgi:hypothetical protein
VAIGEPRDSRYAELILPPSAELTVLPLNFPCFSALRGQRFLLKSAALCDMNTCSDKPSPVRHQRGRSPIFIPAIRRYPHPAFNIQHQTI